ncbi:MAG: hypothetical protein R3190_02455, partial [Thermoanaerobaculia bacterium]|nr:hypothetical protein [Thermoanaerobaculia bacterium]
PPRVDLAAGDGGEVSAAPPVTGFPGTAVSRRVGRHRFELDARCFFQGHEGLLADLVREVCGRWRGGVALDLFAGVGLFAVPLAERYERVVAVESDRIAARYTRRNARAAGGRIAVEGRSVEGFLERWRDPVDRVVVDPPRSGLGRPAKRALRRLAAPRLTYASCNPATLARDLRDLADDYTVESVCLLDLFPQTGHIETVVQLGLIAS